MKRLETIENRAFVDIKPILKSAAKYVALFVFSAVFLLVFSLWTSPMYHNWYGCDASFFTMAGRGILNGWVPYRDFFDLKGPYFFFLEALGQFLCTGRTGAWIIQVFALFFALILMIKTCRLFVSTKKTGFIVAITLIFYSSTLWGGNTLEEFALPLTLLTIYLTLRDLKKADDLKKIADIDARKSTSTTSKAAKSDVIIIKPSTAIITGICFAIIMFSKITVASPIIGLVLAIIIFLIKKRRFYDLITYLLYAFLGVLLGITPIFVYFYSKGMLTRMLYSVFLFAFKRSVDFGTKFNIRWELKISGCYFAMIFVICQIVNVKSIKSRSSDIVDFMLTSIFLSALITAITLHLGDPFIYYFTTVYPILMLTFITMFVIYDPLILFRQWRLDIPIIAFLISMSYFASHTATQLNTVLFGRDNTYYQEYVDAAREMAGLIPSGDRDSVYSLNMDMQWFECNELLPCFSYTINLQFFVALDNRIESEIIDKLNNDPPKWIVIGGDLSSYLPNINDVVINEYTNVYENDYGALYLLTSN